MCPLCPFSVQLMLLVAVLVLVPLLPPLPPPLRAIPLPLKGVGQRGMASWGRRRKAWVGERGGTPPLQAWRRRRRGGLRGEVMCFSPWVVSLQPLPQLQLLPLVTWTPLPPPPQQPTLPLPLSCRLVGGAQRQQLLPPPPPPLLLDAGQGSRVLAAAGLCFQTLGRKWMPPWTRERAPSAPSVLHAPTWCSRTLLSLPTGAWQPAAAAAALGEGWGEVLSPHTSSSSRRWQ